MEDVSIFFYEKIEQNPGYRANARKSKGTQRLKALKSFKIIQALQCWVHENGVKFKFINDMP